MSGYLFPVFGISVVAIIYFFKEKKVLAFDQEKC
jgi:hypothetical protein